MTMLRALTRYIAQQVSLTIGTDLKSGWRAIGTTQDCSVIMPEGGPSPHHDRDRVEEQFVVITRGKNYHEAHARARAIFDALHGEAGVILPEVSGETTWIADTITGNSPQALETDEKRGHQFRAVFLVRGHRI